MERKSIQKNLLSGDDLHTFEVIHEYHIDKNPKTESSYQQTR